MVKLVRIPSTYGGNVPTWKPRWWVTRLKGHALTRFQSVTYYHFSIGPLWLALVVEEVRND